MSTVIGRLNFSQSVNADIDFLGLTKSINKFSWSDADLSAKWALSENEDSLIFECKFIEDPTGLPKIYIVEIEDSKSGTNFKINAQDMTDDDRENLLDFNGDHVDLKHFADAIKPFIRKGFIQISCDASDEKGVSYCEQITVNEDGTGIASWNINRSNGEVVNEYERF